MSGDWAAVDAFVADQLLGDDPALDAALARNAAEGLPTIDVAPVQGKFLNLVARMTGARRILEVGTLGGYSTIWLARALPEGGMLTTLELDAHHAEVARANLADAGLAGRAEVIVGPAIESLARVEGPFDLVFIDADKASNADYVRAVLDRSRSGTVIIVDNVVRDGHVLDTASTDPAIVGTRRLFQTVASEHRLAATALQTVGAKGWDGFLIAIVEG